MSEGEQEILVWPPRVEDLRRLYLDEHLSAAKIAARYGLKYDSPKTAESTVLYHLKKNGISRRDKAEHIRKVTEEMVNGWVKRYEAGESLKQIAGEEVDHVTVFNHLRKRGLQLRDKVEAQIKAVSIHPRTPFSGDPLEKAYLLGFARGDLWITTHGRAVRAKAGSTHPAFVQLFRELFGHYGPIYLYPKQAKLTRYEWSMDADLHESFRFLLDRDRETFQQLMSDAPCFLSYLAGFFDAEGSIYYHRKGPGGAFELSITNMDFELLQALSRQLQRFDYASKISISKRTQPVEIQGADHIWRIFIWRHNDVSALLSQLPLRHSEKCAKRKIALELPMWPSVRERDTVLNSWNVLLARIDSEIRESIREAESAMEGKEQSVP